VRFNLTNGHPHHPTLRRKVGDILALPHSLAKSEGHLAIYHNEYTIKTRPQYPAEGGVKITGDPAHSVAAQGAVGGLATGDPDQDVVALGTLVSTTGDQPTGVTPSGDPGATCQTAGKSKPPRRRKKKQAAGSLVAASSSLSSYPVQSPSVAEVSDFDVQYTKSMESLRAVQKSKNLLSQMMRMMTSARWRVPAGLVSAEK